MVPIFDTHSHLTLCTNHISVQQHVENAIKSGVNFILDPGIHPSDYPRRKNILSPYKKNVFLAIALAPHAAIRSNFCEISYLQNIVKNDPQILALSEIGLDYYYHTQSRKTQLENLALQIQIAVNYNKPIFLHIRGENAFQEARDTIINVGKNNVRGAVHCFTGNYKDAKLFLDMGFYISFSGIVTFKKSGEIQEVASSTPLTQMLVETDSPYLSPTPLRGRPNSSSNITHTVSFLANLRNITENTLRHQLLKNSIDLLFPIQTMESFLTQ